MMRWPFCIAALAAGCLLPASAGESSRQVGAELQLYPAGAVPGLHVRFAVSERNSIFFRTAVNFTDRGDFGEHEDESGGGPGLGVGFRHHRKPDGSGWSFGGRMDAWFMEIDWEDAAGSPAQRRGTSNMTVIQPTFEAAYGFPLGESPWTLEATLALGAEINVNVRGADVGEGAILLGGVNFLRSF